MNKHTPQRKKMNVLTGNFRLGGRGRALKGAVGPDLESQVVYSELWLKALKGLQIMLKGIKGLLSLNPTSSQGVELNRIKLSMIKKKAKALFVLAPTRPEAKRNKIRELGGVVGVG